MPSPLYAAAASAALLSLALTGCTSSPTAPSATASATTSPASSGSITLTLSDGWCKATDTPGAMTGCFGTLHNGGTGAVHLTGASSPVAPRVELHEMTTGPDGSMSMAPAPDGFTIAVGGTFELAPGGHHLMLMDVPGQLQVGDSVSVTLLTDGVGVPVTFAVRAFTGGNESYQPGHSEHPSMSPGHS